MPSLPHSELSARDDASTLQRWGLPAIVSVLLLALWLVLVFAATFQKQRLNDDSQQDLALLNHLVAQHVTTLFRDVESDLRVIDHWLQANPRIDPRTDTRFALLVEEMLRESRGLLNLSMVSADGLMFSIPAPAGKPIADVSDRPYFRMQLGNGERKLFIGDPTQSRSSNKWYIPISWRLESPVGGINVVLASIQLDLLTALHESMRLKPGGSITLIRLDGTSLSRTPYVQSLIGKDFSGTPSFSSEYGTRQSGAFVSEGGVIDGVPCIISYERLEDFPVTVLVTQALADIYATYYQRRNVIFAMAAVLTLAVVAFTLLLHRSQRALRLAKDELQQLEATDSLTGVTSRRAFLERAEREFARARRYDRPAAVLVLDLDHFKDVNDTHGHEVGDEVLRRCAAAWNDVLREQDLFGRIGGEEFCAVLPETVLGAALQAAERLRLAVAQLKFAGANGVFGVTVSIGVALVSPGDERLVQTQARADRALYQAKELGRDRVETLEEPRLIADSGVTAA